MQPFNTQVFTQKDVEKGLHLEFINSLLHQGNEGTFGVSIRIRQEYLDLVHVDWCQVDYEDGGDEKFIFKGCDDILMREVYLPDGHYEYVKPGEEDDLIKEWSLRNPEWERNEFGVWVNVEEERLSTIICRVQEWLEREEKENDSTFVRLSFTARKYGDLEAVGKLISELVDPFILARTGMIIVGRNMAKLAGLKNLESISKCPNPLVANIKPSPCYVAKGETPIATYYSPKVPNGTTLFVTDTGYLIGRYDFPSDNK